MRAKLIGWLIEVHLKFKLVPETLYITVNLIDRYTEQVQVRRQEYQLLGVTAMLIACKYEEIHPPEVNDFTYISDDTYTREQVLTLENAILTFIGFDLTFPTSFSFMQRFF
jgi:hypothetical protein